MTPTQALVTVLVIAAGTLVTRSLAFILFPAGKATPGYISYLGKVLPCATMALLIVYCVKHVKPLEAPHGLPEFISIVLVGLIQHFSRNTLLSIVSGTIIYMVFVQVVFV